MAVCYAAMADECIHSVYASGLGTLGYPLGGGGQLLHSPPLGPFWVLKSGYTVLDTSALIHS